MGEIKIVMVGCHEAGWDSINFLLENGFKFDYFVTISETEAVKQKVSGFKSFISLASKYNIPVYIVKTYSLNSIEDIEFFEREKFTILIQGGWQRLFPDKVLASLSIGAIGVHGSSEFLPKGRGRSPVNWSLIEGRSRFILHFFLMKPGIDDGDIIHYEMFDINDWDTCKTVYYKISILTARFYLAQLKKIIEGNIQKLPQIGEPTYYAKRTAADGAIDWKLSLMVIYNFIRALTKPYPGAFCYLNGRKMTIWRAQPFDTRIDLPYFKEGQVCFVFEDSIVVKVGDGLLLISDYDIEENLNPKIGDSLNE
jgi:methionyl-tRNA formyltransferase